MKIHSVEIDSFKSLNKVNVNINHDCIGLVGVNESGKTNFLDALSIISERCKLYPDDGTKDSSDTPSIKFMLHLNPTEQENLRNQVIQYAKDHSIGFEPQFDKELSLTYHIYIQNDKEVRQFNIIGIKIPSNHFFLKEDYFKSGYMVSVNDSLCELTDYLVISKDTANKIESDISLNRKLKDYQKQLEEYEKIIKKYQEKADDEDGLSVEELNDMKETLSNSNNLFKLKEKLLSSVKFDMLEFEKELETKLEIEKTKNETYDEKISSLKEEIEDLTADSEEFISKNKSLQTNQKISNSIKKKIETITKKIDFLFANSPLENYTGDSSIFHSDLSESLELDNFIPKMIFWKNDEEFILQSSISFKELLKAKEESDISRPLINMFRIAMGIKSFEDFLDTIKELTTEGSKRSRANAKLNEKVNKHIKDVWCEYEQKMQITVEQDQIRIEIYDPERSADAGYYELQERSQGCKAFLSFILTIGAESKTNIINNHLLLLDEPESHLHPSGQRFMLKELQKIAKNNQVIYATHSNHMIIKENYDQHLIIEKVKESTRISQSQVKRIGYFMQEEVLYDAMGVDLSSDLSTIEDYNFVFEGLGDVVLFKHFYEKLLKSAERPFKIDKTKFYQGGRCSDIKRVFQKRPIQLGTKWVFILDADSPADELKKFITGKYKPYVNKDIFVFQYPKKNGEGVLEDIIPFDVLRDSYFKTLHNLEIEFDENDVESIINGNLAKGYSTYASIIKTKFANEMEDKFNGSFKEVLNNNLLDSIKSLSKVEAFEPIFKDYFKFAKSLIDEINAEIKKLL